MTLSLSKHEIWYLEKQAVKLAKPGKWYRPVLVKKIYAVLERNRIERSQVNGINTNTNSNCN